MNVARASLLQGGSGGNPSRDGGSGASSSPQWAAAGRAPLAAGRGDVPWSGRVVLGGGTRGGQVEGRRPCEVEAARVPWRRRAGSRRGFLDPQRAAARSTAGGQVEQRRRGCLGDDGLTAVLWLFQSARSGAVLGGRWWCATAAGRASAASEACGASARAVGDVARGKGDGRAPDLRRATAGRATARRHSCGRWRL
jgi:hypothetical protein